MFRSKTFAALAVALTAATTPAYAASTRQNDALAIDNAGISLSQAVNTAEQHGHGKASRAEYEKTQSGSVYEVEVVNGKKVSDVTINAQDGSIIASTPDHADDPDHQAEHDNERRESD